MSGNKLRPELPELPHRMQALRVDKRGYPVPWFVAWVNGEPDFRIIDGAKMERAIAYELCWLCGDRLGRFRSFTVGPMCAVNRVSAEPPSHSECAQFAAMACPFLTLPRARRREANLPEEVSKPGGIMIDRNPGVTLVWTCTRYKTFYSNGPLFRLGDPTATQWFAQGRAATREEVLESLRTGMPILEEMARRDGSDFNDVLRALDEVMPLLPLE